MREEQTVPASPNAQLLGLFSYKKALRNAGRGVFSESTHR